jgi:hypothetical protein
VNDNDVVADRVVSVLLADGWHSVVPGSFSVGTLAFGPGVNPGVLGFRFEEAANGSPYQPKVLAGPLGSIMAVRQVDPAVRSLGRSEAARSAGARPHVSHSPGYTIAIGFTGEPVARGSRSGAITQKNDQCPVCSQSGTRSSNCR